MSEHDLILSTIEEKNVEKNCNYKLEKYTTIKDSERSKVIKLLLSLDNKDISLILKIIKQDQTCGFNDYAGAKFISEIISDNSPRFFYGNPNKKLFIVEDLGTDINIDVLLKGDDLNKAKDYLVKLSKLSAQIYLKSKNKENKFKQIRSLLPQSYQYGIDIESDNFTEAINKIKDWFTNQNINIDSGFDLQAEIINEKYRNPDNYLAFSHGDMAPTNNLIKNQRFYLIDFEYSGYRHMLYDLTAWNVLCPLPEIIIEEMKNTFYLTIKDSEKISYQDFDREWHLISVWRGLTILSWFSTDIISENKIWVDQWTRREAFISALRRGIFSLNNLSDLSQIKKTLEILENKLSKQWNYQNINTIPKWSVFKSI